MIRVLFVTSEFAPLAKTGGLADVAASLPRALRGLGVDCRVLVPGYPAIRSALSDKREVARVDPLAALPAARIVEGRFGDEPAFIVECEALYERSGGPYHDEYGREWPDNAQRFALLSRAAAVLGGSAGPTTWRADVVHCNDWQAGLAPAYLYFSDGPRAATVFTAHNIAYQGNFHRNLVAAVGLPPSCFDMHGVEFHGKFSFLKAGIYYADRITTVSPTHAAEIQSEALGHGLHSLLHGRRHRLVGILNGIDIAVWNPVTDPHIARRYTCRSLGRKHTNKAHLQRQLGLTVDADMPLFGLVGRLVPQKGIDLVLEVLPELCRLPAQLAVLGTGEQEIEAALQTAAKRNPQRIAVAIGFDEGLAHCIKAGADFFLMPSRYEPCGLNQMYSQRYGTPPIVHATGGLADTVTPCTPETLAEGTATGFAFSRFDREHLLATLRAAHGLYAHHDRYRRLQLNGMARDFGWDISARRYAQLYEQLTAAM
ncbi:MAG: glycogen synthase GlgA [Reyranella sp.]|nr:glycogen synthase GlgA [Reyranella sp.]